MTNKTIFLTSIMTAILVLGGMTSAFATHNPNHNPGGNLQDQIDALDLALTNGLANLQSQIDDIVNGVTPILVPWDNVTNKPIGFADNIDNDTNTQLTEIQVDAFVSNNGFSTGPHTIDTNLNEAQVDSFVSNNGFLNQTDWNTDLINIPSGFADGIDNVGTDTLLGLGCTIDQIAKFNGTAWMCSDLHKQPDNYYVNNERVVVDSDTIRITLPCDEGDIATGGGFVTTVLDASITRSQPSPNEAQFGPPNSWLVVLTNAVPNPGHFVEASVVCLDVTP